MLKTLRQNLFVPRQTASSYATNKTKAQKMADIMESNQGNRHRSSNHWNNDANKSF